MPSPYMCERFHPTRGCSQRKYLFLNFANATPRMQFAKAAPPGFELARDLRQTYRHSLIRRCARLNERRHRG